MRTKTKIFEMFFFKCISRTNAFGFFYDEQLKKYCFHFMGSDKSVVQRTQYFLWEQKNERAIHYLPYFTIQRIFHVFMIIVWAIWFAFLANFKFGRSLLLKVMFVIIIHRNEKKEANIDTIELNFVYSFF